MVYRHGVLRTVSVASLVCVAFLLLWSCGGGGGGGGGGTFIVRDDHGNTRATGSVLPQGTSFAGQIETAGDVDYFLTTSYQAGTLVVYTQGSTDTTGELQDVGGTVLATDDDGGPGSNFRIAYSVQPGTYYIKVSGFRNATGHYRVTAETSGGGGGSGGGGPMPPPPPDDHGNTRSSASSLSLGGLRTGVIERSGDVDYFRMALVQAGRLVVATTGSTLDTAGELQDSRGGRLAVDDDSGTGVNFRIQYNLQPGTYYVRVSAYRTRTGSYAVHASFLGPSPPPTSGVVFTLSDGCNDGSDIQYRFFEYDRWLNGNTVAGDSPTSASDLYVTQGFGQRREHALRCTPGKGVCYGASIRNRSDYWGAGIEGDEDCTGCCTRCPSTGSGNTIAGTIDLRLGC